MGFPPLFDGNSTILILGSFPSVKSREQQFYYGNKQNRFWRTLCEAFGQDVSSLVDIDSKKAFCLRHKIALWDIVQSCEITGSMDTDIRNYTLSDISVVLNCCPLTKILCNGAKSYQLTTSVYKGNLPVYKMPSTSPANVSFDKTVWLQQLRN